MKLEPRLIFFLCASICFIGCIAFLFLRENQNLKSSITSNGHINKLNIKKNIQYFNSKYSDELLSSILIFISVYGNMEKDTQNLIAEHLKKDKEGKERLIDLMTIFNNSLTNFLFDKELGLKDIMQNDCKEYKYVKKLIDFIFNSMKEGPGEPYREISKARDNCLEDFKKSYADIYEKNVALKCGENKMSDIVFCSFIETYKILK